MPVHQNVARLRSHGVQGVLELGVVVGEVGDEVRCLAVAPRAAALVKVQRVEGEAAGGKMVGQLGVEEVVGVAVHRQHRLPGRTCLAAGLRRFGSAPDQGRDDVALTGGITAERDGALPISR